MAQYYSNPERESDPNALPNVEVFRASLTECLYNRENADHANEYTIFEPGYYYWYCFPGCLPDSEPIGPFNTEAKAVENMRENN